MGAIVTRASNGKDCISANPPPVTDVNARRCVGWTTLYSMFTRTPLLLLPPVRPYCWATAAGASVLPAHSHTLLCFTPSFNGRPSPNPTVDCAQAVMVANIGTTNYQTPHDRVSVGSASGRRSALPPLCHCRL